MSFASSDCPPTARAAFSTGFMSNIKPQVELKINLRCVDSSRSCSYPSSMEELDENQHAIPIGKQIKAALIPATPTSFPWSA